ncbi:hypothetical protein CEXT_787291 [Caerostris extrusa]|uniref:Uncharacterized protein n=1 Tax=Caerostris extrusa TaxID=172846 RepID=A0AAV4UN03_CAEEX|nr:hypothetical protein CEXT_787291 [Caerostris extrusa]
MTLPADGECLHDTPLRSFLLEEMGNRLFPVTRTIGLGSTDTGKCPKAIQYLPSPSKTEDRHNNLNGTIITEHIGLPSPIKRVGSLRVNDMNCIPEAPSSTGIHCPPALHPHTE